MFTQRFEIFRLFGFPVKVDLSWFIIFFLVIFSLASGFFPSTYPNLNALEYWSMAFIAALGLFFSIIFHESCHSLVARHYGIEIAGITLFIFGGVAEMKSDPKSAKAEFLVAVAGPLGSVCVALFAFSLGFLWEQLKISDIFIPIFIYLAWMNTVLAIFNLLPAFPMDGGRILRSILWALNKNFVKSTMQAAKIGEFLSYALMGLGFLGIFYQITISGFWLILIGLFIRRASTMSYQQVLIQKKLQEYKLRDNLESVGLIFHPEERIYEIKHKLRGQIVQSHYPIMDEKNLVAILSVNKLKERIEEYQLSALDFSESNMDEYCIDIAQTCWDAFVKMRQSESTQLFILEEGHLVGLISMARILFLVQLPESDRF